MTALFPVPDSWAWTTLGEIAEVVGGVTKDGRKQSDPALPLIPYLRVANVQRGFLDLKKVAEIRVPKATLEKLRLQRGDVLLNEGGDRDKLGRGWVWDGQIPDCIHQNHVFRARLFPGVLEPKLLTFYVNELAREWIEQRATQSVNLASISLSKIKTLPVPVPPRAEQKLILASLESLLSRLDFALSELETAEKRVERFKESIVGSELLRVQDAPVTELGSLLREGLRNGHSARASSDGRGVRTLTLTAITKNSFTDANTKITSADPEKVRGLWLESGDILVQRSNTRELVGTSAIYRGSENWAIFPDLLIRVRVDDSVRPEYVGLVLGSKEVRSYFQSQAKGLAGSMPKIDQGMIMRTRIPVPEPEEQDSIVERVSTGIDRANRIRGLIHESKVRGAHLRRALLREAFAGRLVSQVHEEESASILLERVKAQWARISPSKRRSAPNRSATNVIPALSAPIPSDFMSNSIPVQETLL